MTSSLHDTVLQVADLIDRPGSSRRVDLALATPPGLELPLATVVEPIRLVADVASVVEGLLVRGTLTTDVRVQCSRCLADLDISVTADVAELFTDPARASEFGPGVEPADVVEEGYEIADGRIDLDTLVRDALVPAVPYQPLCDAACRGLCPVCGANRNEVDCDCAEPAGDARWAALEGLRLPNGIARGGGGPA
jgi:uncharacterized protein